MAQEVQRDIYSTVGPVGETFRYSYRVKSTRTTNTLLREGYRNLRGCVCFAAMQRLYRQIFSPNAWTRTLIVEGKTGTSSLAAKSALLSLPQVCVPTYGWSEEREPGEKSDLNEVVGSGDWTATIKVEQARVLIVVVDLARGEKDQQQLPF